MMGIIPYGKQNITQEDINSVITALTSEYLTVGPIIDHFEEEFARYVGSKYAVAVSNGTAALHLSALALGIEEGDKVITTPLTFAASANCIEYCKGEVVFVDIDPNTLLIDTLKLENLLRSNPSGTFKGIIPVDFSGNPVNMEIIRDIADKYNLWIIEDACHAPGGYFLNSSKDKRYCGDGFYADLAIFSFHPVKHICAGEGGMITTNDKELYERLRLLRTHGISKNPKDFKNPNSLAYGKETLNENYPPWYMEMHVLGYNYRITEFQCALGRSQLTRAEQGLKRRQEIARKYKEKLSFIPEIVKLPIITDGHALHLYVIEVQDRNGLYEFLRENNVFAQIHYFPVHLMPYYQDKGWKKGDFPNCELYYERCLTLPIYPTLLDKQQDFIIDLVIKYFLD